MRFARGDEGHLLAPEREAVTEIHVVELPVGEILALGSVELVDVEARILVGADHGAEEGIRRVVVDDRVVGGVVGGDHRVRLEAGGNGAELSRRLIRDAEREDHEERRCKIPLQHHHTTVLGSRAASAYTRMSLDCEIA